MTNDEFDRVRDDVLEELETWRPLVESGQLVMLNVRVLFDDDGSGSRRRIVSQVERARDLRQRRPRGERVDALRAMR